MTGAFLVFPLVCTILEGYYVSELSSLQMLVGTVAFNTLRIIEPSDSNALSIWVLGYMFQGLGMAIAFIVSLGPLSRYNPLPTIVQFITVHFYREIRYGFHRCVDRVCCALGTPFI